MILREWLSGGAPPCQGGGRGFDPRLALSKINEWYLMVPLVLFFESNPGLEGSMSSFHYGRRKPRSTGPRAPRLALLKSYPGLESSQSTVQRPSAQAEVHRRL